MAEAVAVIATLLFPLMLPTLKIQSQLLKQMMDVKDMNTYAGTDMDHRQVDAQSKTILKPIS